MAIIEVDGLCKSCGTREALRSISFSLEPGQIVGVVGFNGSGGVVAPVGPGLSSAKRKANTLPLEVLAEHGMTLAVVQCEPGIRDASRSLTEQLCRIGRILSSPSYEVGTDHTQNPGDGLFRRDPIAKPGQVAGVDVGPVTDRGE